MVERYAHLFQKHKADAVEKLVSQSAENSPTVFTTPKDSVRVSPYAPVAQLDRASDYESEGREFESLRAHHV
jgi:hypothetical protein